MAIESMYWKEELSRISKSIRPVAKPKRSSEKLVCTTERDIMIGTFIVRRIIELHKVSADVSKMKIKVGCLPTVTEVNRMTLFRLDKNYDWKAEVEQEITINYLCNQCVHAYLSFLDRDERRNCLNFNVVSDYDRKDVIRRIPIFSSDQGFERASKSYANVQT